MVTTTEAANAATEKGYVALTTENVGFDKLEPQGKFWIIEPKRLNDAICTMFSILLGHDAKDAIRSVKVGSQDKLNQNEEREARIIVEIKWGEVKNKKNKDHEVRRRDFTYVTNPDEDTNKGGLAPRIYDGLKNKGFGRKLKWGKITRGSGDDAKSYAKIEFDAKILMAFLLNINYADPNYCIKPLVVKRKSENEMYEMSGKERNQLVNKYKEYKNEGMVESILYVFATKSWNWRMDDNTVITGFHPSQVQYEIDCDEDAEGKKKKKHNDD